MTDTGLRVTLDGSQARPAAVGLANDLDRLSKAGTGATTSVDKLDTEIKSAGSGMSATAARAQALVAAQDRLTSAAKGSEAAITALSADLRNQSAAARSTEAALQALTSDLRANAEAQRVLAAAITGANQRSREQVGAARSAEAANDAAAGSARDLAKAQGGVNASSALLARSAGSLGGLLGGLSIATLVQQSIALSIEFDRLDQRFKTVFGSANSAGGELAFVRGEADRLGASFSDLAGQYSGLAAASKGTSLEGQKTRDIFSAIAEASGKLQLTTEQTSGALLAVQQIISKGTVSAEELRGQLGERLPGAFQIAARAMGVTTAELGKLLEQGSLASDVFLPKFAEELRKTFGTDASTRIESLASNFSRLRSEIQLAVTEANKFPNQNFGSVAGFLANRIAEGRKFTEQANATELQFRRQFGTGDLAGAIEEQRAVLRANPFKPQIDPFAPIIPKFSVVPPASAGTPITGPGILGEGVQLADAAKLLDYKKESIKLSQDIAGLTNVQRVQQSILNGELKGRNILEREAALDVARKQDALAAQKSAGKADPKRQSEAERYLATLQGQVDVLGLSTEAAELYRIKLAQGVTPAQIAHAEALLATKKAFANQEQVKGYLDGLQQQADLLGKSTTEAELYKLSLIDGVTPAQQATAIALRATIDAQADFNSNQQKSRALIEATRTPLEQYVAQLDELQKLQKAGVAGGGIDSATYDRAVEAARKSYEESGKAAKGSLDEINVFADQAARNIQSSLADAIVSGFDDGAKGALISFAKFLQRASAEALAADITGAIFGGKDKGKGGDSLSLVGLLGKGFSSIGSLFGGGETAAKGGNLSGAGGIGGSVIALSGAAFASPAAADTGGIGGSVLSLAGNAFGIPSGDTLGGLVSDFGGLLGDAKAGDSLGGLLGDFGGLLGDGGLSGILGSLGSSLSGLFGGSSGGGLFASLSGLFGGGSGAASAGGLASLFSGFGFADGGRPPVGQFSLVGEQGPELLFMDRPGTVIPNDISQGLLGGKQQPITVNAPPVTVQNIVVESEEAARRYSKGAEGQADVLNHIRRNPTVVKQATR